MSHLPERKEKICLNCSSVVYGRFCHICGQENVEPKESFWHLLIHFFNDLTHFDGKFFTTTRFLLFRPGFLAREYMRGRRSRYLNPIRMYIFTSAVFFLFFFWFIVPSGNERLANENLQLELVKERSRLQDSLIKEPDSLRRRQIRQEIAGIDERISNNSSSGIFRFTNDERSANGNIIGDVSMPESIAEYDSLQRRLPHRQRDNWLWRTIMRRAISINQKYEGNATRFLHDLNERFTHSVPQMMFISLPLVALVFQLLYVRHKKYFYVNHVIFVLNLYIAVYILLLLFYTLSSVYDLTGASIIRWLALIINLLIFVYLYKSMRNFYLQSRGKTV
ncbi:MAG TPA: DUF3667 domain-containing protein, partial [Chitinophagaceae bacterium]